MTVRDQIEKNVLRELRKMGFVNGVRVRFIQGEWPPPPPTEEDLALIKEVLGIDLEEEPCG